MYENFVKYNIPSNAISDDQLIITSYILYKQYAYNNSIIEYYKMLRNNFNAHTKILKTIFFLLEEENLNSIDILIANIKSIEDLKYCLDLYYKYNNIENYYLPDQVVKNITRLINIIVSNTLTEIIVTVLLNTLFL